MKVSPSFSFVIPARNERRDIIETIRHAQAEGSGAEIVVVDDGSTDGTLELLEEAAFREDIVLARTRGVKRGLAAARNVGVDVARGDVVVFVDADVRVPKGFCASLRTYYAQGYEFVAVDQRVANQKPSVGRFLQALHEQAYPRVENAGFTQAFSCLRPLAQRVKFPEELPTCGGEDGEFFRRLQEHKARGVRAPALVVDHEVPADMRALWHQWKGRGRAATFVDARLRGRSLAATSLRRLAASSRDLGAAFTVVWPLVQGFRCARLSQKGARDGATFALYEFMILLARTSGYWQGLRELAAEEAG